jgi:hypothetical protein
VRLLGPRALVKPEVTLVSFGAPDGSIQVPTLPEWGAMLAFGPGITIETMVLRAPALKGN